MNEDRYVQAYFENVSILSAPCVPPILMIPNLTRTTTGGSGIPSRAQGPKTGYLLLTYRTQIYMTKRSRNPAAKEVLDEGRGRAKTGSRD